MEILKKNNYMIKRIFAYILDLYLVSLSQFLLFAIYNFLQTGVFHLSMLYVINNFKFLFIFFYLFYFFVCEFIYRKTIGKKIFKLEVVYSKRDLKSIFIRTIVRLVPIDVFFILINRRTLHDILSNTNVIEKKEVA